MTIGTMIRYLVGRRAAILEIARTPSTAWLGMLFVLSAGFAREYDAQDLLHKPWYLALPLVASLATSFLLYALIYVVALRCTAERYAFWSTYRTFLAFYWLTAPLAWLYAIPVERFLSDLDAAKANLTILAIVALWRVLLMMRVVVFFFGTGVVLAASVVMLFGSTLAIIAVQFSPVPILAAMGGIHLTPRESLMNEATFTVACWSIPTWIVSLLGVGVTSAVARTWSGPPTIEAKGTVSAPLWSLAVASIIGWSLVLPITQREQHLRYKVEHALLSGRIDEGIAVMSQHSPSEFPPHWDPPPWRFRSTSQLRILDVLDAVLKQNASPWVRQTYADKLATFGWERDRRGNEPENVEQLISILERLPEAPKVIDARIDSLKWLWSEEEDPVLKETLRRVIEGAGHTVQEATPPPADNSNPVKP